MVKNIAFKSHSDNVSEIGSCSCNEFVSSKGYGRCEKDFQDGPICYVNQPSICKDAISSQSQPGQYFSWEACNKQHLTDQKKQRKIKINYCTINVFH